MKEFLLEKGLLKRNYNRVRQEAGGARLMAVLKNNAYGLGLLPMAGFWREMGVTRFGIGDLSDAAALRAEGFHQEELLLMRSTAIPEEIELILDRQVIATIGSQEAAVALGGLAEKRGTVAEAHIKIDCGMGRYGFLPEEMDKIKAVYQYMNAIAVSGVYTQIPSGLSQKKALAAKAAFDGVLEGLRAHSLETGVTHALGSTALFAYDDLQAYDMVRVGAAISGRVPGKTGLSRVGVIEAPVADIRWIPPGHAISKYFRSRKPVRAGLLPVGYADGFMVAPPARPHAWRIAAPSSRRPPSIRLETGEEVKVLGHVGQNHMCVDLTNSKCAAGTLARIDINPLFAGNLPRTMR